VILELQISSWGRIPLLTRYVITYQYRYHWDICSALCSVLSCMHCNNIISWICLKAGCNFTARRCNSHWDEWASVDDICTEVHELLHQGNPTVKHSYNQHVSRPACCGWVQDCWNGLCQILPGSQDGRGWAWTRSLTIIHFLHLNHFCKFGNRFQDAYHFLQWLSCREPVPL